MAARKGFLLVTMEPPAAIEEEFNDWYDSEHVPERLAVQGFETATRYVSTAGWPKYCAFYDLSAPEVIDSCGYRAISGDNFSPWTKRMLARVRGFYRTFGEQIHPGAAPTAPATRTLLIRLGNVAAVSEDSWVTSARQAFEGHENVRTVRVFRSSAAGGGSLLALVELGAPLNVGAPELRALGELAEHVDLVNEYALLSHHAHRAPAGLR